MGEGAYLAVEECLNTGTIRAEYCQYDSNLGGIIGSGKDFFINQCNNDYSFLTIHEEENSRINKISTGVGGIVGRCEELEGINFIINSGNSGNITSDAQVAKTGGLAGVCDTLYIENCLNIGSITNADNNINNFCDSGTMVGAWERNRKGNIVNSYYINNSKQIVGNLKNTLFEDDVKALLAAEIGEENSYKNFDFNSIWEIGESGYPIISEIVKLSE